MNLELDRLVDDFAMALMGADSARPGASNARSKAAFQPGIGPHSEAQTVKLVGAELERLASDIYGHRLAYGVAYPEAPRQKCDLCIGSAPEWDWAVEIKMLRILGNNGKANDNILMHLLSPYAAHRSALTDCDKLVESRLGRRKAILVYGLTLMRGRWNQQSARSRRSRGLGFCWANVYRQKFEAWLILSIQVGACSRGNSNALGRMANIRVNPTGRPRRRIAKATRVAGRRGLRGALGWRGTGCKNEAEAALGSGLVPGSHILTTTSLWVEEVRR
jgi:hypothetical protein